MSASQPAYFSLQQFSDLGALLVGGRLYTYTQGTTTLKTAYTDPAGAVPQTYTADGLGGQYIALNARGELPAPLYLTPGSYDIALKRADGSTVWTRRADPTGDFAVAIAAPTGAGLSGFLQNGTGAVPGTVLGELRARLSITQFGAVCDGVTDDSAAVQLAINYCATFTRWPALVIPGRCRLASSVNIDRLVDTTQSEFRIIGQGPGAGFYVTGNVTMFDSTIAVTVDPKSEFITFENIQFESSSVGNTAYVVSPKFLRMKFLNCNFRLIRCTLSTIYLQTMYFVNCNIRNNPDAFLKCSGLYDVVFDHCIIENGNRVVDCRDPANIKGALGLRFIGGVIEGLAGGAGSIATLRGAQAFDVIGVDMESNGTPWFNLNDHGTMTDSSVNAIGNVCVCANAADKVFYYGATTTVTSTGNTIFTGQLHNNVVQVANLVSTGDVTLAGGSIHDTASVHYSTRNGVTRAGTAADVWSDSDSHISKDSSGNFGLGIASQASARMIVLGKDQTNSAYAARYFDSAGNTIMDLRNDRIVIIPTLGNYANDAAAAAAGVPIGGLYRIANAVQVRLV